MKVLRNNFWKEQNNDDDTNLGNIFACNDNGDPHSYFDIRSETDGNIRVHILDNNTKTLDFDIAAIDINSQGSWNHLAFIVDSSGNRVIVNGNAVTPTYSTGSASTQSWLNDVSDIDVCSLGVNRNNSGFSNYFDGLIDDFAYFDTVLSTSEAQQLYNDGNSLDLSE